MSKKIITIHLVMLSLCLVFMPVFAATDYATVYANLESVIADARIIVENYEEFLTNNAEVLEQIPSYEDAKSLKDGMLNENVADTVNAILTELEALETIEATNAKAELETIKAEAETLVDDSKEIIEDVKNNYENFTPEEVAELVTTVQQMVDEFGITNESVPTFDQIDAKVKEIKTKTLSLKSDIKKLVDTYNDFILENISEEFARELADTFVNTKDAGKVFDALISELETIGTTEALAAKSDIYDIKEKLENLKVDAKYLAEDLKEGYIFLTSSELESLKKDAKNVISEYANLANYFVDTYLEIYISEAKDIIYEKDVLKILNKMNELFDNIEDYKAKVEKVEEIVIDKVSKYGAVLLLLDIDQETIESTIENKINEKSEAMGERIVEEIDLYLQHMQNKYMTNIENIANSTATLYTVRQLDITEVIEELLEIKNSFTILVGKVSSEVDKRISNTELNSDMHTLLDTYEEVVTTAIDEVILFGVETNFVVEEEKFSYLEIERIFVFKNFDSTNVLSTVAGIDYKYFQFASLKNNKIATSSKVLIKLSDLVQEVYEFAVLGDVNSDGAWDISDVVMVIDESIDKTNLSGVEFIASDITCDGICDISDVVMSIDKGLQI